MSGMNLPTDATFHAGLMETMTSGITAGMDSSRRAMPSLEKAAKDFESVFIHKLMDSMRKSIPKSGLLEDVGSDQMKDLFWHYMAEEVGRQGGFGVWKQLQQQLSQVGEMKDAEPTQPETESRS